MPERFECHFAKKKRKSFVERRLVDRYELSLFRSNQIILTLGLLIYPNNTNAETERVFSNPKRDVSSFTWGDSQKSRKVLNLVLATRSQAIIANETFGSLPFEATKIRAPFQTLKIRRRVHTIPSFILLIILSFPRKLFFKV